MADVKISQLPAATTPLDGTELAPIVQSGTTKRVSVANLTVGRALTASSLTLTTPLSAANGGTGITSLGTGVATFLGTPSSANLAAAVTDETGTGALVFASSPTIATPTLSTSFTSPLHIGGTTASSTLTLQSTSGVGTSDSIVFKVGNNGATTAATFDTNGTFRVKGSGTAGITDAFLVDGGASASAARIDASGNLLVGTTSAGVGKLCVYTSSNTVASADFRSTASGDVGNRSIFISKFDNNTTTSQIFIQFAINNATVGSGQINADGANVAAFGSYSDIRLKENITPLPCQLSKILALKPSEFDYRDGSGHQIGFIAQEMQEVYPDVVGEGDDGMLTITGWSKTEARLVKAIQELAAKVSALEARI